MRTISALFDPRYYLARVRTRLKNNTQTGLGSRLRKNAKANLLFDPNFYSQKVPGVVQRQKDLLEHFLREGWREGYDPHPLFSIQTYLAARGTRPLTGNPLIEFVTDPSCFDLKTHPLFSSSFYKAQYPDVREADTNALLHYVSNGWKEGRRPHLLFDPIFYKAKYPDIAAAKIDPLIHYVRHGSGEGRRPHPLFDPTFYRQQMLWPEKDEIEPLAHFLQGGWRDGFDPHPLFSVQTYLAARGSRALPENPLVEFLTDASCADFDPHPLFSSSFYKVAYPNIADANLNALLHYVSFGSDQGRRPNPTFDPPLYHEQPIVAHSSKLEHFLTRGLRVGLAPTWRALRDGIFYRLMLRALRTGEVSRAIRQDRDLMQVESLGDILTVAGTVHPLAGAAQANITLRPATPYPVPAVRILGSHSLWPEISVTLPSQEVSRLDDVIAIAGTRLVITSDGKILHDELSLPDAERYGEKLQFIRAHAGGRILAHISVHKQTIEEGILLASDSDDNYFHWMIEALAKIELIEAANIARTVPFLVADHVPTTGPHNQDQLISSLADLGFEILDTGTMTLDEQITLWGEAAMVIVPTGASLTNIIFADANTRILILAPDTAQTNPYIFTQIARNLGLDVTFLFCAPAYKVSYKHSIVHDDYYVDCDLVVNWARLSMGSSLEEQCPR
jgi:hypothetical protein